jgi:alkylhydroperoxidase family enzyme
MGHTEMLLAVAGLTGEEIKERTARLADGEWSAFSPSERVAFRFASRLTSRPWEVSADDVELLADAFGRLRALDLIWHVAWCNYMTRVAEALQLPLETTNVFATGKK